MADDLTEEVEHAQIEIVLFYLSVAYLEIVEKGHDQTYEWFFVVQI